MFHTIPPTVLERMRYLEQIDTTDREDGTPRLERLRQVPPETGKFIALLAACAPAGTMLEIGTSAGYSTLWLALACRPLGRTLVTFEVLPEKADMAKETFAQTGTQSLITLVQGDACERLSDYGQVAFCFLDAEKEVYGDCYDIVVPNLVSGGLLLADNAINHRAQLAPMLETALTDERVDALVVPVGNGVLVCRKI